MFAPEVTTARPHPTEFLTENGFAIIRLCDIDPTFSIDGPEHCFVVRDPHGYELEITVDISREFVAEVIHRSMGRISLSSSYWINCAERHLSEYLWEHEDYPPNALLSITELSIADVDLAQRWGRNADEELL
jgi:hypothetical protein